MSFFLETGRLGFRPWGPEDLPELASLLQDPVTMAPWPRPFPDDDVQAWFDRATASWAETGYGRCAVIRRLDGAVLGDVGLMPSEMQGHPVTDLGYILHHRHHGQGYAAEAAKAALAWGVDGLGLSDIVCHMAEDNIPSRRVAERIGLRLDRSFVHDGNRGKTHLVFEDLWARLRALEARTVDGISLYAVRSLGDDTAEAVFRAVSPADGVTRRTSRWQRQAAGWTRLSHEVTPVPAG